MDPVGAEAADCDRTDHVLLVVFGGEAVPDGAGEQAALDVVADRAVGKATSRHDLLLRVRHGRFS